MMTSFKLTAKKLTAYYRKRELLYSLILIAILFVGIMANLIIGNKSMLSNSKMDKFKVGSSDNNITFQKPGLLSLVSIQKSQAEFQYNYNKKYVSYLAVAITETSKEVSLNDLNLLDANYLNPQPQYYQALVQPQIVFLQDRMPVNYKLTMDKPVAFRNNNIHHDAWMFTYQAQDAHNSDSLLKGKLVYAINGKYDYYLTVNSKDKIWQSNQNVWNQILNSIEIK